MSRFLQSWNDFPLTVSFGEKVPAWGLSRWNGGGLRFLPPDDEAFTLRGGSSAAGLQGAAAVPQVYDTRGYGV
jgi:hypothetical protein